MIGLKVKAGFLYLLTGIPQNLLNGNIFDVSEVFNENISLILEQISDNQAIKSKAIIAEKYLKKKVDSIFSNKKHDDFNALKYLSFNLETLWNFGYYDYAHFSKDFKKYCGQTFESYKKKMKIGENLQVNQDQPAVSLPKITVY